MKKFAFTVAFVIAGMGLQAQDLQYGVKAGLTYNMTEFGLGSAIRTSGEVLTGNKPYNGWHIGVTARDEINKNFFLQFDGLYNQTSTYLQGMNERGHRVESEFLEQSVQANLVPGIMVFNFVRLQGGLNGNLWLNQDYVNTFGRFQLGYQLGIGADVGPITLDIAYNAAFKNETGEWNSIPLTQNRGGLMMSVGILF